MVVLGMSALMITSGSALLSGTIAAQDARPARDTLIDALQLARARAQAGAQRYGVFIGSDSITVFEGDSFADRTTQEDLAFPRARETLMTGTYEFVFEAVYGTSREASAVFGEISVDVGDDGSIRTSSAP